ncbi:MAG: hypothetical protein AB8H12_10860 [Lewinella sp.]
MTTQRQRYFRKLWARYKYFIIIGVSIFVISITLAFLIYTFCPVAEGDPPIYLKLADFLMSIAEAVLLAGLIGGGLNFAFEEMKKEEDAAKERQKTALENRHKYGLFRRELRQSLGVVHDNVGLARILIKSHKSGKTYGEQIRNRIMPSLISLQDIRREIPQVEDPRLKQNLEAFRVSLNYMIAYLSVLVREFEANYLTISNLQTYQDAYGSHLRGIFTETVTGPQEGKLSPKKKQEFVEEAAQLFEEVTIPVKIDAVWQAIEDLDFVWDYIAELRDDEGNRSMYFAFFLIHYNHCTRILRSKDGKVSRKITSRRSFTDNVEELKRIDAKSQSDVPLTNKDMLTWKMMEEEMGFDLKARRRKVAKEE